MHYGYSSHYELYTNTIGEEKLRPYVSGCIALNRIQAIRGFRGACYVFFTSKIHAIKKMKKNAPLRIKRMMLTTAQINPVLPQ
jgi:hypothetical protein